MLAGADELPLTSREVHETFINACGGASVDTTKLNVPETDFPAGLNVSVSFPVAEPDAVQLMDVTPMLSSEITAAVPASPGLYLTVSPGLETEADGAMLSPITSVLTA